jgi:hypothetical protein
MKVAVVAKFIVTQETYKVYIWIFQYIANIWIIFANQKLTPTILEELGIHQLTCICILRGDFYHLLNEEVWPNHFHFSVYPQKFLSTVLLSKTQEEWDDSYLCALDLLTFKLCQEFINGMLKGAIHQKDIVML